MGIMQLTGVQNPYNVTYCDTLCSIELALYKIQLFELNLNKLNTYLNQVYRTYLSYDQINISQ